MRGGESTTLMLRRKARQLLGFLDGPVAGDQIAAKTTGLVRDIADLHTPATPPADPEREDRPRVAAADATAREKQPGQASASASTSTSTRPSSQLDHDVFLRLDLRLRTVALQLRTGSDVECSAACLEIQTLSSG